MTSLRVGSITLVLFSASCFLLPQAPTPRPVPAVVVSRGSGLPAATAIAYATEDARAVATIAACYKQSGTYQGC
jgi:hypothetical protein